MYNFSKSKKILFAIMAVSSLTFAACSQKNSSDENVTSNQAQTEYESKSSGTQAVQQETTKEQIKGVNKICACKGYPQPFSGKDDLDVYRLRLGICENAGGRTLDRCPRRRPI
ncbi:MAG: hypothetical protein BHW18_10545 [Eubacterium sp. 36_13]|nr:MAG: hypothetical protein BHW18_10545 [Eubacterium sp. 36_13]